VATGKSSEIKLDITTDEKDNEAEIETVTNEVDAFDISPSGRRAVISVHGQILTIATDRGDITRINPDKMASRSESPKWSADGKWVAFSKQDRTLRSHVYIAPIAGGGPASEHHLSDESLMYSETNAVWTADGRYIVFTSAEGASNGIATQGGLTTTMELWATSLVDQDRDPMNRDIDNEAQGLAAEAAARQAAGRGGATAPVPDVKIDWSGLARRARQLTVPGTAIGGLTPAP